MIHRNEFNKVVQLIDAGIIGSHLNQANLQIPNQSITNFENFQITLIFPNPGIEPEIGISKTTANIDNDILFAESSIIKMKEFDLLKIGKNSFNFDWNITFLAYEVNIEDILFNHKDITENNTKSSLEFQDQSIIQYLNSLFENIKDELLDGSAFSELSFYKSKLSLEDYNNLISIVKIKLIYQINFLSDKIIKNGVQNGAI